MINSLICRVRKIEEIFTVNHTKRQASTIGFDQIASGIELRLAVVVNQPRRSQCSDHKHDHEKRNDNYFDSQTHLALCKGTPAMTEGEEGKLDEVDRNGTPVMGIGLWGLSPLCEIGISRRSVYQMTRIG